MYVIEQVILYQTGNVTVLDYIIFLIYLSEFAEKIVIKNIFDSRAIQNQKWEEN